MTEQSQEEEKIKKKGFEFGLLRKIYALASPYKKILIVAVLLTLLMAVLAPTRPFLIQYTIDEYIRVNDLTGLTNMTMILIVLLVAQAIVQFYQTYLTNFIGQSVIKDLRMRVFQHISRFRLKFFDRTPVGTLVTRAISDIEAIADTFSQGLITISGDILQLVFVLGMMFYVDWQLSLVSLAVFPLLLYSSYIFKNKIRSSFLDVRNNVSYLNTFVQEHIQGMQIVQIFNKERVEMEKFKSINRDHRDANIRSVLYYSIFFPVVEIITSISMGLLVWWGAKEALDHQVTTGTIIAFILYINMFFRPIRQLADRFNALQMGMVASERIFRLIDNEEDIEPEGKKKDVDLAGSIQFRDVWFGYNPGEYVLKDINLKVEEGETLALVGATGAGKTSAINLLSRFYEIDKGSISINGQNIKDVDLSVLRRHIAVVLQDVFLFSGSILENIRLFDTSISEEEIIKASKLVGADKFIRELPDGYHQEVFERGGNLSTGQRQLISFVRAMVFNPSILVLDEATSSVDSETEEVIQHAIGILMKGRTAIVIAHRLSTIQNADKILVLDHGRIIEEGSHSQLLELGGNYKRLYEMQYAH